MLLQKKDNEGFGFVLRGAKGELLLQSSQQLSNLQLRNLGPLTVISLLSDPLQLRLP